MPHRAPSAPLAGDVSADDLESLLNSPSVHPWVSLDGEPISGVEVARHSDYVFGDADAAFVFVRQQPGVYHLHSAVRPSAPRRHGYMTARAAARRLFCTTDAHSIFTVSPHDAPHSTPPLSFGFQRWFSREACMKRRGSPVGADFWRCDIDRWRDPYHIELGRWFHGVVEAVKPDNHPDDATHDRFVGLALSLALGGRIDAAIAVYNTWALLAGYVPVEKSGPATINMDDLSVSVIEGHVEVLCR